MTHTAEQLLKLSSAYASYMVANNDGRQYDHANATERQGEYFDICKELGLDVSEASKIANHVHWNHEHYAVQAYDEGFRSQYINDETIDYLRKEAA